MAPSSSSFLSASSDSDEVLSCSSSSVSCCVVSGMTPSAACWVGLGDGGCSEPYLSGFLTSLPDRVLDVALLPGASAGPDWEEIANGVPGLGVPSLPLL